MINNLRKPYILDVLFGVLITLLVFGRPLLGVYIIGFRLAEFLVGFSILITIYYLYSVKKFKNSLGNKIIYTHLFIIFTFLCTLFIYPSDVLNIYTIKNSINIWYISYFFLGFIVFNNFYLKKAYFYWGYSGLALVYILNSIYYPNFLESFFENYSDKFQYAKAAEIAIFFIFISFFNNKFFINRNSIDIFIIVSSLILPLVIFKSRSAGVALIVYFIFELYTYRHIFLKNLKRNVLVLFIFTSFFALTSHNLVDNIYTIEETDQAITGVFKNKYVYSNTYDETLPIFYIFEGRLYSADGNLNWRLQLWQDAIKSLAEENKLIVGFGYSQPLPLFQNLNYSGLDSSNENSHNYFINILLRGGMISLFSFALLFYYLYYYQKKYLNHKEFLRYLLPLFMISMFDGSMENPYFGILFFFSLSIFFVKNNIKNINK